MPETDTSKVYSEAELVDILNKSMEDPIDRELEQQVCAVLKLMELGDNIKYCDPVYARGLQESCEGSKILRWVGNMAGHLANKGFVGFENGLRTTLEHTGTLLDGLYKKMKDKSISEDYISERFDVLRSYAESTKGRKFRFVKDAVEFDKQQARFEGIKAMCAQVVSMAESADDESFASDRIWDTFASMSNHVVKAVEPKPGSTFREFQWIPPFTRSFDFVKSEWMNVESIKNMKKMVLNIKYDAFEDLVKAAKYIKSICGDLQGEVEHKKNTDYEIMSRQYARTYVVTKFIQALQGVILKEINTFCSKGIKDLGKFDENKTPKTLKDDEETEQQNKEQEEQ